MKKCFKKALSGILASAMLFSSAAIAPTSVFAAPSFGQVGGWFESIYAEIPGVKDADVTGVSYSGTMSGSLSGDDLKYLVRDYNGGVRIDIPGLKEGTYNLTVTTSDGTVTKDNISVMAYDRSGYAHFNYSEGVGAYNDDGTLKDNAIVLYVTEDTKNSVTLSYGGKTVTGIGNILNSRGADSTGGSLTNSNQKILKDLGNNNIPLVVRIVGDVKAGDSNTSNNPPAVNIDGLTAYDSTNYGGSEGDNGMMARIQDAKNITIEGIGADASINGWGIHFVCGTDAYNNGLGKSCEIRNIYFQNYPEDAFGAEGQQSGSTLTAPVERIWVHNNNFGPGYCKNAAESDKKEGDGSCDFKRGQYYTMAYNKYWDCHKTNLIGSSDSSLQYHMSMHHNYYENCMARGPLARQGNIHMYNNVYIGQSDYAMNTRANAYIFSEYNLLYMCKNPMRVDAGAIKSYNDSLSACIEEMGGTVVTDKNQKVSSGNKYENFDTNSSLSYIPSGNYILQEDVSEAKKVVMAYAGVMKENVVTPDEVSTSLVEPSKQPSASVVLPYSQDLNSTYLVKGSQTKDNIYFSAYKAAGDSISIKEGQAIVFNVNTNANITITDGGGTYPAVLMNDSGVEYLTGSGTAYNVPAGTYFIQPGGFSPAKDGGEPSYKESKISYLGIEAYDPEAPTVAEPTTQATSETPAETTTKTSGGDVEEPDTEETTSAPYEGEGLVWDYTSGVNTLGANVDGNEWGNAVPVSYNGSTFTSAIKMESSTSISFNAPGSGKLTLVTYSGKSAPEIKVNGETITVSSSGATTVDIAGGTVTISKGTTDTYLYMMEFVGSGTVVTTEATTEASSEATTEATTEKNTEATTEAPAPVEGVDISVGSVSAEVGDIITVPVKLTGMNSLANYSIELEYASNRLQATDVLNGDIISDTDGVLTYNIDNENGIVKISATNVDEINSGDTLVYVVFKAIDLGNVRITLTVHDLYAENLAPVEYVAHNGIIYISDSDLPSTGMLGDVDKNGKVDAVDAAILLKIRAGIITNALAYDMSVADYNQDGEVDGFDVIAILNDIEGSADPTTESTTETTTVTTTETTTVTTTEETTEAPAPGALVETANAGDLGAATYTSALKAGKFVITADATNTVAVDANNKSIDGYNFTQRIKLSGAGTADYRSIKFDAASAGNVVVYAASSNGTDARVMQLVSENGDVITTVDVPGSTATPIAKYTMAVPSAGTYYVASVSGGLNVYLIGTDVALNDISVPEVPTETTTEGDSETTTEVVVGEGPWTFDIAELTAAADKEAIADGTKVGTDGFFTVTGEVTKRTSSTTGDVTSIEVQKAERGAIVFTVATDSYVEFDASSTGTTNTSAIGLKSSDGTYYVNTTVTGSANGRTTFAANVPAGTYSIVSPLDTNNDRGARVYSVSVETGTKDITSTTESTTESTSEETPSEDTTAAPAPSGNTWTAGDTAPSWLNLNGASAAKNSSSYNAFADTNGTGTAFEMAVEIASGGTFTVTPQAAGTIKVYAAGDNNTAGKGDLTAAYADGSSAGSYTLPGRKDTAATAFEVAVSDAQVGSEITFTTDYATLLFRVDM